MPWSKLRMAHSKLQVPYSKLPSASIEASNALVEASLGLLQASQTRPKTSNGPIEASISLPKLNEDANHGSSGSLEASSGAFEVASTTVVRTTVKLGEIGGGGHPPTRTAIARQGTWAYGSDSTFALGDAHRLLYPLSPIRYPLSTIPLPS